MSVIIRWLVVQEVCSRLEFARHFESHLARPVFYMRMRTTISDEHSIVTMLLSTRIIIYYSQPIRLTETGRRAKSAKSVR